MTTFVAIGSMEVLWMKIPCFGRLPAKENTADTEAIASTSLNPSQSLAAAAN
jgi:hypothetical protein